MRQTDRQMSAPNALGVCHLTAN